MMTFFKRFLLWPLLLTGHFLAVCLLSWHLLAQVNFAYPLGYQLLEINQHIQRYAPENRYKSDFAQTTPAEHRQIFEQITQAVQNHGQGLAEISYHLPNDSYTRLMREPEVIHLQDVANLIDVVYGAGLIGALFWLLSFAYAFQKKLALPALKKILSGFLSALIVVALIVLLIGPTKVFYWLHEQIFPDEHEWFFFYQDSLMTTLMKAPDLFGFISVLLIGVFIGLWALTLWGMVKGLNLHQKHLKK
jgi:hypothetical protein